MGLATRIPGLNVIVGCESIYICGGACLFVVRLLATTPPNQTPPNQTPPNQSPYSPKAEDIRIKEGLNEFTIELRSRFDGFLKKKAQLPLWTPSSNITGQIRRHITGLEMPIITPSSKFPSLLLHKLGQQSHDPQLTKRVDKLFRLGSK